MSSAIPGIKAALFGTVLPGLFSAPTLIAYGMPGSNEPPEIVGVMNARATIERPVHGTARAREETVDVDVVFSVWAPGGESQQQVATERAFVMLSTFADYFKTAGHETLGVGVRDSWVSDYSLEESVSYDASSGSPTGRVATITATLTAKTRI